MKNITMFYIIFSVAAFLSIIGVFFVYSDVNPKQREILFHSLDAEQDQLPELLRDLPDTVTATIEPFRGEETWIKITNTAEKTVSIPIIEFEVKPFDSCRLDYSARVKSEHVKDKAYLEMLCYINNTPYFSRGINQSVTGFTEETKLSTPFYLSDGDFSEKLGLGIRIEGPGTVWIRNMEVWKYGASMFSMISFVQYGWTGAFLGILGGIYGCIAGFFVPKGKAKELLNGLAYFVFLYCFISLCLGIMAWLMDEQYGICYALIHTGLLGLIIFVPIHMMTIKTYQNNELQRMKAMDSLDSVS